jgi:tetratricopeptide (TPR) repeat protein
MMALSRKKTRKVLRSQVCVQGSCLSTVPLDLCFCLAQSIGEAFCVDPADQQQRDRLTVKPANLQSIFDVYLKTREKVTSGAPPPPKPETSTATKAEAEKLKQLGNSQMSRKEYTEAIHSYTEAISLDATNAVYYSNRAAAYSSLSDHQKAIDDAEKAIETDPKFVKAFSRLGYAPDPALAFQTITLMSDFYSAGMPTTH